MKRLEILITRVIDEEIQGIGVELLKIFLVCCSWFYQGIITLRNRLYNLGVFRVRYCPVPVISIGNIVAGGTGKTPFTVLLAKELANWGKVAIILRGYRSRLKKNAVKLACAGEGALLDVEECGDEAFLLCQRFPEAIIVVGRNRYLGTQLAIKQGAQMIILDDGFQHRALHRDFDILMANEASLKQRFFLPRGYLRDEKKRYAEADYVFLQGLHEREKKMELDLLTKAPLLHLQVKPLAIRILHSNLMLSVEEFIKQPVHHVALFCGIAQPQRFLNTVQSFGKEIVETLFLADHETIHVQRLIKFMNAAKKKGAEMVLCTEKDYVKLMNYPQVEALPLPLASVQIQMTASSNAEWQQFLYLLKAACTSRNLGKSAYQKGPI